MVSQLPPDVAPPRLLVASEKIVADIYADLDVLVARLENGMSGDLLTESDLAQLTPLIEEALQDLSGLAKGCGFMAVPDAVAGTRLYQEWWQYVRGEFVRLELDFDTDSESYYDYTDKEYFSRPMATGERWVEGPYVDYLGIDQYIFTFSTPVRQGDRIVGLMGADVPLQTFQNRLLDMGLDDEPVALVNRKGRVILSTEAAVDPGSILRIPRLAEWLTAGQRNLVVSEELSIWPCEFSPWAVVELPKGMGEAIP